ncbi:hypothetical protein O9X98_08275 [Agrobacterium salinitolerans]|nr:hypothetical protein [Agrobacterium salinitolerans]
MSECYEIIRKNDPFAFPRSEVEFFFRPSDRRARKSRSNRFANVYDVGRVWRLSKHSWGWRAFSHDRRRGQTAAWGKASTMDAALQACMQSWKKR